jgi:hypothetical protein
MEVMRVFVVFEIRKFSGRRLRDALSMRPATRLGSPD